MGAASVWTLVSLIPMSIPVLHNELPAGEGRVSRPSRRLEAGHFALAPRRRATFEARVEAVGVGRLRG
jgi:hypothetical protein